MTKPSGPVFIKPALAEAATELPKAGPWVHEIKFDGYRMQVHISGSEVILLTRNGLDWTDKFAATVKELRGLPAQSAIIDCEAVVLNEKGIADFGLLQREFKRGHGARMTFMALDLLELDGVDLRKKPLIERKTLLKELLGTRPKTSLLQFSEHMEGDGNEVLRNACLFGLEGIVSKRIDKPYQSGRSSHWLKIKCVMADPFVIVGYTDLKGKPGAVGALALGYFAGGKLTYAGRVGTGFTEPEAALIWEQFQTLQIPVPTFAKRLAPDQRAGVTWIEPLLVAQVEYRSWTSDGLLRHSAFKSFRQDKQPTEIGPPPSMPQLA